MRTNELFQDVLGKFLKTKQERRNFRNDNLSTRLGGTTPNRGISDSITATW